VHWQLDDGSGAANHLSAIQTTVINVQPLDAPPVVTAGHSISYTELAAPAVIESGLAVTDSDNTTLASATVAISGGLFTGDELKINGATSGAINNGANGTINYAFAGSTLTLSGSDTVADYQAALQLVTFDST